MWKWEAIYDLNGSSLKQFEGETERLFKNIEQDKIIAFRVDKDNGRHMIVDLKKGIFMVNGSVFEVPNLSYQSVDYRLIYFRRVTQNMGQGNAKTSNGIETFVGFQFTKEKKNYKAIISEKNGFFKIHIN